MFKQMLLGSARAVFAPENDQGSADDQDDLDLGADDAADDLDLGDDLGDDDGDASGDDQDDGRNDQDEPPPRRESRAAREIRQLREDRQRLQREVAEARAARQPPQQRVDPAEEERAFQARIADLPFEQQLLAVRDRERQVVGQQLQGIRLETAQIRDESKFAVLTARNPVALRLADEVEREFEKYAANGTFVARQVILESLLGKQALARGPKAGARDGKQAGARVAAARTRGAARESTTTGGRADPNSLEAIETRLRNVPLSQI